MSEKSPLIRSRLDDVAWYALHPDVVRIIAVILILAVGYAGYAFGKSQATQVSVTDVSLTKPVLTKPSKAADVSTLVLSCSEGTEVRLLAKAKGQVSMTVTGSAETELLSQDAASLRLDSGGGTYNISYTGESAEVVWSTASGECAEDFSSRSSERDNDD